MTVCPISTSTKHVEIHSCESRRWVSDSQNIHDGVGINIYYIWNKVEVYTSDIS